MPERATQNPIFEQAYWERPSLRMMGEENPSKIYHAVGYALSQWEHADQALSQLFLALTGCSDPTTYRVIQRSYGSITSNSGRREAVLAAAEIYFAPSWEIKAVRKSIVDITDAVGRASRRRDDVAHGIVWGNITVDETVYGSFLMPPEYNTGRTYASISPGDPLGFQRAKYRYISDDIEGFAFKFSQLRNYIWEYTAKVYKRDGKIPLIDELAGGDVGGKESS
jgi:hypothetical protein